MSKSLIDTLEGVIVRGRIPQTAAASFIGVTRSTLYSWMARATPIRPRFRDPVKRFIDAADAAIQADELGTARRTARDVLDLLKQHADQ